MFGYAKWGCCPSAPVIAMKARQKNIYPPAKKHERE
jgi:hypothetical protein